MALSVEAIPLGFHPIRYHHIISEAVDIAEQITKHIEPNTVQPLAGYDELLE